MSDPRAETKQLANQAFASSGCRTHAEFVAQFGRALPVDTFRKWLAGSVPAQPLALLVLREYVGGWRPSCPL